MGNTGSKENVISEEALNEYVELTYLNKNEIRQIYKRLDDLEPGILKQNLHYRFSVEQINKILPQIHCNPFCDVIYRVFSSKQDGHLSFEDTLDLSVRAAWAFEIFDFDGDNQVSLDDLIEMVRRLAGTDERGQNRIDRQQAEDVARMEAINPFAKSRKAAFYRNKFPIAVTDSAAEILQNRNGYHIIIHDCVLITLFFQILQEIDLSDAGNIAPQEFIQLLSKMPDFAHTFQFKIN
ncbi:PREDICTED: LOW QUALITY PROTEIN: calcium and integrin-binding protein 1-like [Acromyrmex echinatior]|uniref:LOW QUALITY PROTEIN: calcium and integrin-binding protein 1-like n=1 Tax=Acromyrmex echinatior TaxID=103372 RepID=UPI000580EB33|nr:PREDICTED: LOW QUALITY PROTEIN: calcium and integrin-binding protein 1-like [Acromyrmex echinatior]